MKKHILFFHFLLLFFPLAAQQRIYVYPSATGAADGTSWADAFTDLQLALQSAAYGDTMWVAEGTYQPTADNNRDSSFKVPNGLRLYGGFAGTETALEQRDWNAHPVILDGNIGDPNDTTDNSYNIMYLAWPDSFTVVDGFTFRFGYAEPQPLVFQDGTEPSICGGAMYIQGFGGAAYPDIRHCTFEYNYAWSAGGAVFVNGKGEDASVAPRFLDCTFRHNRTAGYGGGVYRYGGSWAERYPDFGDCLFEKNFATQWGGGVYYFDTERTDTLHFSGCRFVENEGEQDAGAMALNIGRIAGASMIIRDCEFDKNRTKFGTISGIRQNGTPQPLNTFIVTNTTFSRQKNRTIGLLGGADENISLRMLDHCRFDSIFGNLALQASSVITQNCEFVSSALALSLFTIEGNNDKNIIRGNKVEETVISFYVDYFFTTLEISNNLFLNNLNNLDYFRINANTPQYLPVIQNCTFINNQGTPYDFKQEDGDNFDLIYRNCLFYHMNIDTTPTFYEGHIIFNHCYFDEFGCADQLPYAICQNTLIGGDPGFADTASGDYRLSACSMLRDAGSNTGLGNVPTDFAGNPRIRDGIVDIGAYETPGFAFSSTATATPVCADTAPGSINLQASNGCEPYLVTWQNGAQSGTGLSELSAGTYFLSVTDQGGRLLRDTVHILQGGYPEVDTLVQPVLCGQTAGGTAVLLASGGQEPYSYLWADGNMDAERTGLVTGVYRVTVRDAAGCTTLAEAIISPSGTLDLSAEVEAITCFGVADGALSVLPADGLGPYLYKWAGGQQQPELTSLGPGLYRVTVIDALGCNGNYLFSLTEPLLLSATVDSMAASGEAVADGSLTAAGQGGTGPYQYAWSSGDQTPQADMLLPGSYELTLTDQHGCNFTGTYSVPYSTGTSAEITGQPSALLYPNPASAATNLYLRDWPAGKVLLTCFDASGRRVFSRSVTLSGGFGLLPILLEEVPAGAYRLVAEAGNISVRMSFVVIR